MTSNDLRKQINLLIQDLRNNEKLRTRRAISDQLKLLGNKSIEHLLPSLNDDDWKVREGVIIALDEYSSVLEKSIDQILPLLNDENIYVRQAAGWLLGKIKSKLAIEPLMKSINKDIDEHEQFYYALGLAYIEGKDSFGDLKLEELHNTNKLDKWQQMKYNSYLFERDKRKAHADFSLDLMNRINLIIFSNIDSDIRSAGFQIQTFSELITNLEAKQLEFKASLRYCDKKNKALPEIELRILETIVAFMNAFGGIIIIGVSDNGEIIGLKGDYQTFSKKKQNSDGFKLRLTELYKKYKIKIQALELIKTYIEKIQNEEICFITVQHSDEPVFLNNDEHLIVRLENSNTKLSAKEAILYSAKHYKKI